MDVGKDGPMWRYRRHIIIIVAVVLGVLLITVFTDTSRSAGTAPISKLLGGLVVLALLATATLVLSKASKIADTLEESDAKLDKIAETLEKNRSVLNQVNQSARLSETAKAIAFRDADRESLREAVFDKLQQKDFETAYDMIDEVAHSTIYQELVKQLTEEANRYRDATDQERINQVIAHIQKLFDNYQWAKASGLIERLIKAEPECERARELRQELVDKKNERKKVLLAAWDDAVKRQDTDRSLEILRELDLYLTSNEGLALQEAARGIFRNKLHNLGVEFSLAISGRQWTQALETGAQIIRDFPNSRMAEEIHAKWDALKERAKQGG
ncbi:MAG: hypothetical protein ACYSR5_10510 [Planctomycetota bacterium]|jgi:hypothetical protein